MESRPDRPAPPPTRALGPWLVVAAVLLVWGASEARLRAELDALPPAQRGALVRSALTELGTVCGGSPGASIAGWCREQAKLVLRLPECGSDCQQAATALLPRPTR